jgi:hypothetical protein
VSHYFQVLALIKSYLFLTFLNQLYSNHYNKKLSFKLIKQELQQVIIVKQFHNSIINITLVNYYLMTDINKQLFISESHDDLNRCTPCRGKPDQHNLYASRASPRTPRVWFLRAVHVYDNLSHSRQQIWTDPLLSRRRDSNTTPSASEWSAGPHPASLPNQLLKQWEKTKLLLTTSY